jgi:hypothetical protein
MIRDTQSCCFKMLADTDYVCTMVEGIDVAVL